MYFQIDELAGKPQSIMVVKNLKEATEMATQTAIELGVKVLHFHKYNCGFGMCGGKTHSNKTHCVRIK